MQVGLPGIGISGVFYILLGLVMPVLELGRAIAGRSSVERWKVVLRQFTLSVITIAVFDRTYWAFGLLTGRAAARPSSGGDGLAAAVTPAFPVAPVVITVLLLAVMVLLTTAGGSLLARSQKKSEVPEHVVIAL